MARQTYYVTREQKHPLYKTRMLQAGPLELDASAARLYRRLGVDLSEQQPEPEEKALADMTKAELAAKAGLSEAEAKKLTKPKIIELIEAA